MNKLRLLGIATEPYYTDKWEGATIHVLMEEGEYRLDIEMKLRFTLIAVSIMDGYQNVEPRIMKCVKKNLDAVRKIHKVTPKDINTIYEIVRLKMQRFVHKSALKSSYFWNAVTGEIREDEE
jgi:hypothetical protein